MTNLTLRINHSVTDSSYVSAPGNYIDVDESVDTLIFSAGSTGVVADNLLIPDPDDFNRAATILTPQTGCTVAHYFLSDVSTGYLREALLAGAQNKQYAFCCSFDGATTTEPQLEAWDDANLNTYADICLGAGTPSASWYHAVCTTLGIPGSTSWSGTSLAGSAGANVLLLNSGSGYLTTSGDLYFNFRVDIPSGVSTPGSESPVLTITYTTI